jgi:hypothetical protein
MTDSGGPPDPTIGSPRSSLDRHSIEIERMVAGHAALRDLCEQLEACADLLPDPGSILRAALVSASLAATLRSHDAMDAAMLPGLIPGLLDPRRGIAMGALPGRIRACHASDQLHAEDLHDALAAAAIGGPVHADTLGYMMRALFDGCRRGICFQEAVILLLGQARLTASARALLWASLTGRPAAG